MDRQTAERILSRVQTAIEKRADDLSSMQQAASQGLRDDALGDVGRVALFSLGLGAAGRGAMGLYNVLKRNMSPPVKTRSRVAVLPLPVKAEKTASLGGFLLGSNATTKEGIPWYHPAMFLGGLASAYGGWKGIDAILNARRKKDIDEDVEQARREFSQALLGEHSRPVNFKAAGDNHLSDDLDRLFEEFEKAAGVMSSLSPSDDTLGKLLGAYSYYALPAALIGGYAAYSSGKGRQRAKILESALKARAMRRHQQQPEEVFAMPVPVEYGKPQTA